MPPDVDRGHVAEVVAIELVGERCLARNLRVHNVVANVDAPTAPHAVWIAQARGHELCEVERTDRPDGDDAQRCVECCLGGNGEWLRTEIGVRVGVQEDSEIPVIDHGSIFERDLEVRGLAIEVSNPGIEPSPCKEGVPGIALEVSTLFDLLDHSCVEANSDMEQEIPLVC